MNREERIKRMFYDWDEEKDIIRDFINQNKLGEFLEKNEIQVAPTPVSEFTPKFCHRCGAKLSPGTRFCTSCGAQIR